jgi:hypothetical protein
MVSPVDISNLALFSRTLRPKQLFPAFSDLPISLVVVSVFSFSSYFYNDTLAVRRPAGHSVSLTPGAIHSQVSQRFLLLLLLLPSSLTDQQHQGRFWGSVSQCWVGSLGCPAGMQEREKEKERERE